jgi:hypothetical protein
LYDQYVKQMSANPYGENGDPDPAATIQTQMDKRLKALEGVRTPAQLDSFRQFQAAQMKMIQGFLPDSKKAPPTTPSPSGQ